MKILIADKFESSGVNGLKALGCEVISQPELDDKTLAGALTQSGAEILIVRSTKVIAAALEATAALALIIRAGAGVNTIDVKRASERGVFVANTPGKNAAAVAELALGLILALDRRIADSTADLRTGKWDKKTYSQARGLKGRTLGILGLGQIGREVAARAKAFDMRVIAWSRSLTEEQAKEIGIERADSPLEVARQADVLTVHMALAPETKAMVTQDLLGAMPKGGIFVNTGRGELIAPGALEWAAKERGLRLGLDVFTQEPAGGQGDFTDPIIKESNVYGTHHIGASTEEAQEAVAAEVVRIVERYQRDGYVLNCVNIADRTPATSLLVVRHQNRPGVLAHVLDGISREGINVEEMENIILAGAHAACARIRLDGSPGAEALSRIQRGHEAILGLTLVPLPDRG